MNYFLIKRNKFTDFNIKSNLYKSKLYTTSSYNNSNSNPNPINNKNIIIIFLFGIYYMTMKNKK
jgi:hypothetical protein